MAVNRVGQRIRKVYRETPRIAAVLTIVVIAAIPVGAALVGFTVGRSQPVDPCPVAASVIWDNGNQGHNAYASNLLTVHLEQCTTLLVTSGHMTGPDRNECGYQGDQMCVLAFRATRAQDVAVTTLDPGHTWYGVTRSSVDAALAEKRTQFFAPPNCAGNGCATATVFRYLDGSATPPETLRP